MELAEIRELSVEELKERVRELRKKIFELRIALRDSGASLKEYRLSRKELARTLMVLKEKQRHKLQTTSQAREGSKL